MSWFTRNILHVCIEHHVAGKVSWNYDIGQTICSCSYCRGTSNYKPLHYGLNIPKDWKSWNSWYVIKFGKFRYLRWTNQWIKLLFK